MSESSVASSLLYQPPVLRLSKGQTVQTRDGQYVPQVDEVWHSDARFRQLEQENLDLVAQNRALQKLSKNRIPPAKAWAALRQLWKDGDPAELPWDVQYALNEH